MTMILALYLSLCSRFLFAFDPAEPLERWLVELNTSDEACLVRWYDQQALSGTGAQLEKLPVGQWWLVILPEHLGDNLNKLPCVSRMMPDAPIEWRKQPNDPVYINQADMNLIGMPKAWDIATGGVTAQGDTIVVALIDDGFQVSHPDLQGNIWINREEIQGDGIDNDLNGYVDDRLGYNVNTGNDQHEVKSHGTSVAGIVGAKGNNDIGVTGVNWNVKLMLISGADFESKVIQAYQYILDQRTLYNQTAGAKGAFGVVTNLSGGINNAWAADHPMWCEMYDKLGEKGILSVTAAPNQPISVDDDGDMPTTCTSPYMIAVTNVDPSDVLVETAGFGATSIDLGAPGHGTVTTASGSQYKEFPGTSAAAPHVAGAIALMYSTPCENLLFDIGTNPSATADRIRDILFNTAKPNNSLNEITVLGKRLQVDAALEAAGSDCDQPNQVDVTIQSIQPNPTSGSLTTKVYFSIAGDPAGAHAELFTVTGAKVFDNPLEQADLDRGYFIIEAIRLMPAVYILRLWVGDHKVTRKLVVAI